MAQFSDHIVAALYEMVSTMIDNRQHAVRQGTWNFAESVDANLSSVTVDDREFRYVPKLSSVTGLAAGDGILLVRTPDCPLIIIGKRVGDITLAEPL